MIAVDTNVLLRYLYHEDDPAQGSLAVALVEGAAERDEPVFLSAVVLCELVWTLKSALRVERREIVAMLHLLLAGVETLVLESEDAVREALDDYAAGGGTDFADCLIARVAQGAGATTTYTFDRTAAKRAGFKLLK